MRAWADDSCRALAQRSAHDLGGPALCYCGPSLGRVRAQLPSTLQVLAACKMQWDRGEHGVVALRPAADPLDLDRTVDGNYPHGRVYLRGQLELEGVVRFGDEGAGFSAPQRVRDDGGPSWLANSYLYRGVVFTAAQERQLKPPRSNPNEALCKTRTARLRFTDFEITITDQDSDGSRPGKVEVLSLGPLRACAD